MLADSEFDAQLHQYNADFVDSFAANAASFDFSRFEIVAPQRIPDPSFNGTLVRFTPSLLTYRTTKQNTQKIGAIMYRYAKGKPVPTDTAEWQCAFMYGYFIEQPFYEEAKPEDKLCLVLCAVSGETHRTPKKPIYKYNEMKAVCSDIAERWDKVPPPPNAILP